MKIISLLTILFFAMNVQAQGLVLSGQLIDKSSEESLIGGHVTLLNIEDSLKYYAVSDYNGMFSIQNLPKGKYDLLIQYIGYDSYTETLEMLNDNKDLGVIFMLFSSAELKQVEVHAMQQRAIQLGDTTQYNANAYKTNSDANTEDLIKKMPGVTVEDGEINAQGEKVTQVLVDGKPYFGSDPNTVLKNLPAGVVAKIQIFDGESEEAQAAGFSDGNTQKTINIILKEEYKKSVFGNVYGGYGYGDQHLYSGGGSINIFDGNQRISILGQSNNVNIQNFSSADLVGVTASVSGGKGKGRGQRSRGNQGGGSSSDFIVPSQGGLNLTNAIGINYQNSFGEQVDLVGSYFFNHTDNRNTTSTFEDYFNTENPFQYLGSETSTSTNMNHRANLRLKYKINKNHELRYTPSFTYQFNRGDAQVSSQNLSSGILSNLLDQETDATYEAFNLKNQLSYIYKFEKPKRQLSISASHTYNKSAGLNNMAYENLTFGNLAVDTSLVYQNSDLDNIQHNWQAAVSFSEPLNNENSLRTRYTFGQILETYDKFTYDEVGQTEELNTVLSNTFENQYQTHKGEIGHSFRNDKINLTTMLGYQAAILLNTQNYPYENTFDNVFHSFLPSVRFRYKFDKEKNIAVNYRSRTKIPSITSFQNVLDNSNPLQLEVGNPELKQQTEHGVDIRYFANNGDKGSVFFASLGTSLIQNYIAEANYLATTLDTIAGIELAEGVQLSRPVNLSGYSSTRGFLNYGMPIKALKSNLNFNLGATYSRVPTLFNDENYFVHNEALRLGVVLGSNISENIDFTLSSQSSINFAQSGYSSNTKNFNQTVDLRFVYQFLKSWKIEMNAIYQYYTYFESGTDTHYGLINLGVSKYFLKNNQLEIYVKGYDLLNQNINISQVYTDYSFQQTESLNLNRYFMVGLKYKFNSIQVD